MKQKARLDSVVENRQQDVALRGVADERGESRLARKYEGYLARQEIAIKEKTLRPVEHGNVRHMKRLGHAVHHDQQSGDQPQR